MTRRFLVFTLGLFLIFAGLFPANTSAQADVKFRFLEVDFWPEYDRAAMLVIYRVELDSSVSLPVDLTFRIPARVGMPHAVAAGQSNDSLFTITAERQVDGEWAYITFNTTMPVIRLEFYDDTLITTDDSTRNYAYTWSGDYAVDQLSLQVQQPIDAANLQLAPGLGAGSTGPDGLVYYTGDFGPLTKGQTFDLSISYQKESERLSINTMNIATDIDNDIPGRSSLTTILPWVMGFLAVILIAGGAFWYFQSGKPKAEEAVTRRGRRTSGHTARAVSEGADAIYCSQCGRRAGLSDKFCRSCGARLHT